MELYINSIQVAVENQDEIQPNFTYSSVDTFNPSAVKSSYSKTISLPDHPTNRKVFGVVQDRYSFELHNNGRLMEKGYCTLDSTVYNSKNKKYNVTLYGQLGNFFYNLKGNSENSKSLADLYYGWETSVDYPLRWNPQGVVTGWNTSDTSSIYHTFKGCPCISEKDKTDKGKTFIYSGRIVSGSQYYNGGLFPTASVEVSGTYIASVGGNKYVLAESEDATNFQRHNFLVDQMPIAISYQDVIKACCNPINNGGYTVNLDPLFFNDNNPYWTNMYILRDMPSSDYDYASSKYSYSNWTTPPNNVSCSKGSGVSYTFIPQTDPEGIWRVQNDSLVSDYNMVDGKATFEISPALRLPANYSYVGDCPYLYWEGDIEVNYTVYTSTGNRSYSFKYTSSLSWAEGNVGGAQRYGGGNSIYILEPKKVTIDLPEGFNTINIQMSIYAPNNFYEAYLQTGEQLRTYPITDNVELLLLTPTGLFPDPTRVFSIGVEGNYVTDSKTSFSLTYEKKDFLGGTRTPFDYLIDYTKMFNLRYVMHRDDKIVDILHIDNYIQTTKIKDIQDSIDYTQDYKREPKVIDEGTIKFDLTPCNNSTITEYSTSVDPNPLDRVVKVRAVEGQKDYLGNLNFNIGTICRKTGNLICRPVGTQTTSDLPYQSVAYFGFNQNSPYNINYASQSSSNIELVSSESVLSYVSGKSNIYDFLDVGGSANDVLVMYAGMRTLNSGSCLINHTTPEMVKLNEGKPCYVAGWNPNISSNTVQIPFVLSNTEASYLVKQIPCFGLVPSQINANMGLSFSNINYKSIVVTSNIYELYHENFIKKVYYDPVTVTCYVRLQNVDLRSLYWFDNNYWILTEVENWNYNDTPVKAKFVKYNF